MAYLRLIRVRLCTECGTLATVSLRDSHDIPVADYCVRCGNKALSEWTTEERGLAKKRLVLVGVAQEQGE